MLTGVWLTFVRLKTGTIFQCWAWVLSEKNVWLFVGSMFNEIIRSFVLFAYMKLQCLSCELDWFHWSRYCYFKFIFFSKKYQSFWKLYIDIVYSNRNKEPKTKIRDLLFSNYFLISTSILSFTWIIYSLFCTLIIS